MTLRSLLDIRSRGHVSAASLAAAATIFAIALGVAVRAFHVLSSDFPLNDGGMFYAMAQDLQRSGYHLPGYTSYNGGSIPFTYPPLGFYVAALVDDLTPLSLVDVFRFLPLLGASLTVPAFYLLARSMLANRIAVIAATLAFALVPRSFMWMLMGGGVTRSLGLLFAILALFCMHQRYVHKQRWAVFAAPVLCALTVLSHLETGWFLAFSIALFYAAYGRNRSATLDSAIVAVSTVLLTAPWWLQVYAAHGIAPLETAFGTGGSIFAGGQATRDAYLGLLRVISTSEPLFPLIGVLGALGAFACLATRRYFLPIWWAAIVLLDVRAFPTFTTLPVALMAGICVSEVLLPLLRNHSIGQAGEPAPGAPPRLAAGAILGGLLIFALASAMLRSPGLGGEAAELRGLSRAEVAAMTWVRETTPSGASFLVIPDSPWETARTAEWFPALANRYSVATVQGTEWVSGGGFERARRVYDYAYACGYRTTDCLDALETERGIGFDYVYISKDEGRQCCSTLVASLAEAEDWRLVYEGEGASIYLRRGHSDPAVRASEGY